MQCKSFDAYVINERKQKRSKLPSLSAVSSPSICPLTPFSFCWNINENIKFEIFQTKRVIVLLTSFKVKKSLELTERSCLLI